MLDDSKNPFRVNIVIVKVDENGNKEEISSEGFKHFKTVEDAEEYITELHDRECGFPTINIRYDILKHENEELKIKIEGLEDLFTNIIKKLYKELDKNRY